MKIINAKKYPTMIRLRIYREPIQRSYGSGAEILKTKPYRFFSSNILLLVCWYFDFVFSRIGI